MSAEPIKSQEEKLSYAQKILLAWKESEEVKDYIEEEKDKINEIVEKEYQNLLKENSREWKKWPKFKPNPEKLNKELKERLDKNSKELMNFINNSQNKFILSQEKIQRLSDKELNKKLFEIWNLLDKYENSTENDRKKIREITHKLPNFYELPKNIQEIIKYWISDKNSFASSQWAENINQLKITWEVYKLTKNRHDNDYFSILQLVKFMLSLEKDFRDENKKLKKQWKNIEIKNANEWIIFYTDENWNYKRLIKQSLAPWESVDIALKKELYNAQWEYLKKDPINHCIWPDSKCKYKKLINPDNELDDILAIDFNTYLKESNSELFQAYKDFLQSIQNISKEKWYLLDISDSRQWAKEKRWNVLNTSNIFVKKENWKYIFTVIDPDVFNKDWKNKFDWKEQEKLILEKQLKNKKVINNLNKFKAKITWILTEITNFARDWIQNPENKIEKIISKIAVAPKQEKYMKDILENKEYNVEVDEKLKKDLIFYVNISRLAFRRYKKENWKIVPLSDNEIVDNETKYNDSIKNLEKIWKKIKIIDFYPKTKEEEKSWFWWIFIEVDWEKFFIPKWTKKEKKYKKDKLWNIIWYKKKDVLADIDLMFEKIPIKQVKSMIDFFERLNIKNDEKINILWNSLWWALWQIMLKMNPKRFKKWIFPHSPWASDLKIDKEDYYKLEKKYKKYFENYKKNKKVDAEILYIDWENPFKPISWLWKKLESKNKTKQYIVTWWFLHFMPQLIKYMNNLKIWNIVKIKEKS